LLIHHVSVIAAVNLIQMILDTEHYCIS